MKKLLVLLLLFTIITNAQKEKSTQIGRATLNELQMAFYDKDSTATAVVLYEHANVYLDPNNDYNTRTDYYFRIKILDKSASDQANISIDQYKKCKVKNIKGITYNTSDIGAMQKSILSKDKIFIVDQNESWKTHRFTMPNVKEGSIIEYSYSIISPYLGVDDWYFQSDIPKIKSEFDAAILGNYRYNVALTGYLKLDKEDTSINKKCVYIQGLGQGACILYSFGMNDVPAFKEEDFMLSKKNYISHISFELETYTTSRGIVENYTKTWKDADKRLKKIFLNNQTSKKSFFRKNIPENILTEENQLNKAKKIYTFIQNHYTWNSKYWNTKDDKVKQAFENKVGTAGEINLSLYNALEAADIPADLVILSTRNHGIPKKIYPVIFDFNYVIVRVKLNDTDFYLDATDKFLPFGQIPFRTLNGNARIINYKKASNWVRLVPRYKSSKNISAKLVLNEDGDINGNVLIRRQGYSAQRQRKKLTQLGNDGYIEEFEEENIDVEVENYTVKNKEKLDQTLQEVFNVNILFGEDDSQGIRLNPFFFDRLEENPFKLNERNYPVDFGYAKKSNYVLSLKIPDNYEVTQLPKKVAISLPNKGGSFVFKAVQNNNIITVYSRINTNKSSYSPEEYFALKEYFKQIVIAENSFITLEKK